MCFWIRGEWKYIGDNGTEEREIKMYVGGLVLNYVFVVALHVLVS